VNPAVNQRSQRGDGREKTQVEGRGKERKTKKRGNFGQGKKDGKKGKKHERKRENAS